MSVCFYKRFCFSGKHLKNVKLSFTNIFQKIYFALLAFKVSKTFLGLLAFVLACFLKVSKTFLCLLAFVLACFLKVSKTFLCLLAFVLLKAYKILIACLLRSL